MSTDQISTVGELMDYLATQPRDRKVILQKDAEGDGYSPLAEARGGMYLACAPCAAWSGEVYPAPEDVADDPMMAGDNRAPSDAERVVVLGPVN